METTLRQRWMQRPQSLWLRRAIFQVHLWTGVILGLYVFLVSLSGSAIVFRSEIYDYLWARSKVSVSGEPLSPTRLRQAAELAYPGSVIRRIWSSSDPTDAAQVILAHGARTETRFFDPYTGKDLGPMRPEVFRVLKWLGDLHGSLLMGETGLLVNGMASWVLALLCLTGLVVWWPGKANWRRSLTLRRESGWKRFNWDLHSAVGFWIFSFLLMWGLTGAYFVFPAPFRAVIEVFTPINRPRVQGPPVQAMVQQQGPAARVGAPGQRRRRPPTTGQKILNGFSAAHYGTFGGWPMKAIWGLLGIAPAILFVTSLLMWWNRVLGPAARRFIPRSDTSASFVTSEPRT